MNWPIPNGWETCVTKGRAERIYAGQFFTPPPIARCLAGWFEETGLDHPSVHLLDPGAGVGTLTTAAVERITVLRADRRLSRLKEVTLEVWELDPTFLPALRKNLTNCVLALENAGVRARVDVHAGSYIEAVIGVLDPVHLFDSRKEAFGRDDVLQENVLFHLIRGAKASASISLSTGSLTAPVLLPIPPNRLVDPTDHDLVIHLPTEADSNEIRDFFKALPCRLIDFEIEVSTGPVVHFRLKKFISNNLGKGNVPLIYLHCIKVLLSGILLAPAATLPLVAQSIIFDSSPVGPISSAYPIAPPACGRCGGADGTTGDLLTLGGTARTITDVTVWLNTMSEP